MLPVRTFMALLALTLCVSLRAAPAGTAEDPIVDSAMTEAEAFDGLDGQCPYELRLKQQVVTVLYYSFDHLVHRGQVVVDAAVAADIKEVFAVALAEKFPLQSVIPIAHKDYRKEGKWSDERSMLANNTSAFNYRAITGGTKLSNHSYGRAIDLNPVQNPYLKGTVVEPAGAKYDPAVAGTLTAEHPVTKAFMRLGWTWGGTWTSLKDYQHFEKPAQP